MNISNDIPKNSTNAIIYNILLIKKCNKFSLYNSLFNRVWSGGEMLCLCDIGSVLSWSFGEASEARRNSAGEAYLGLL